MKDSNKVLEGLAKMDILSLVEELEEQQCDAIEYKEMLFIEVMKRILVELPRSCEDCD